MASMQAINPAAGGPVGGGIMMMNNGSPAVAGGMNSFNTKEMLNGYIYDYLLKNGHYDSARSLIREEKFDFQHVPKSSPGRRKDADTNGDSGDGMDLDGKDDAPDDLPRPLNWTGTGTSPFLFEWFNIFMDLFSVHRSNNGAKMQNQAAQYLMHEKNNQRMRETIQNQNLNRSNMNNPTALQMQMRAMNGGKLPQGQVSQQQIAQVMQQKRAQMMQQQAARGEQPDGEMNGGRPSPPVEGDATGSPSKRQRMDGVQPNFQPAMMQNGRPAGVPANPNQGMMIQSGFNPAMTQQFQRNGAMPPKNMQGGMPNAMMNMPGAGSPMMNGMNQFGDNIPMEMYNRQNLPGGQSMQAGGGAQSGNHALQDYQMQLMLLEQQNKKRLMMARQEQHENNPNGAGMPGVNMQPGLSPSGSRTGTSPNPGEMAGRSPAAMSFMGNMQTPDFNAGMFNMKDQQMMAGGPQGMRPPTSNDMNMRPAGARPNFQGGQPMQQQNSQAGQQMGTPGQRTDMPPPSAPGTGSQQRNSGNSPGNAPPTPSQSNKAPPKGKKGTAKEDATRKRPNKKGSTTNASGADENPPATPQPSTPITPNNPGNLNNGNKAQPGLQQGNQHQQNQAMPMSQQMSQDFSQFDLNAGSGPGGEGFNLDFSTLENQDVLENFDFDSFLNTSADEGFNFGTEVELGGDFGMGQGE